MLVGLGYGVIQPLIYDETVDTAIPENNLGTGLCNGDELSGDSIVPVHYRLLSDLVPH